VGFTSTGTGARVEDLRVARLEPAADRQFPGALTDAKSMFHD
jgi:hypothetical protein